MAKFSESHAALPERSSARPAAPDASQTRNASESLLPTDNDNHSSAWDSSTKRTVILILLIVAVVAIWAMRQVIPILVIAGVIAYFLSPIVDLGERIRIPRAITTIFLYMILLVGLVLTPILLAPVLVAQLSSLNFDVPTTAFRLFGWFGNTLNTLPSTVDLLGFSVPVSGVTEQLEQGFREFAFIPTLAEILSYIQQLISTATNVVSSTAAIGVSVVGSILQVLVTGLLVFFLSLYLTKDAPNIRSYIEGLFPRHYQSEWIDLLRRMGFIWQSFFRGQLILCVVVGFTTWAALQTAGMPGALILGTIAGALEIIPTLGPILSMIPAVFVALIQGSTVLGEYGINNFGFALITMAIYFIIQQLENYILVPRIIGDNVNLHPIVVLCGVTIGFNLFGILGALFAAPVLASLRVLGGYIHAKLLDYAPFEHPVAQPKRHTVVYRRTYTGEELEQRPVRRRGEASSETAALAEQSVEGRPHTERQSGQTAQTASAGHRTAASHPDAARDDSAPGGSNSSAEQPTAQQRSGGTRPDFGVGPHPQDATP